MREFALKNKEGSYLTTVYNNSVSHCSRIEDALKTSSLETACSLVILATERCSEHLRPYSIVKIETTIEEVNLKDSNNSDEE